MPEDHVFLRLKSVFVKASGRSYDFIIVGSGTGGATLARELAILGKKVLVVEKGSHYENFGSLDDILQFHDASVSNRDLRFSEEGIMLLRTFMAGGSTIVSCGNGIRCLEKELAGLNITLEDEFLEAEREMNIAPISESFLSPGSKAIMRASEELGYHMEYMPKFINPSLCSNCGNCFTGCEKGAKWTAVDYLYEARDQGAEILFDTPVQEVITSNGKVSGIITRSNQEPFTYFADRVILCAGALATPLMLNRLGLEDSGKGLFVDTFVNVYGITRGLNQMHELPMALVDKEFYHDEGFIISTFMNPIKISRFAELGSQALTTPLENLLGMMIKIRDERTGTVHPNGIISKSVTPVDQQRLQKGMAIAKEILVKAGADEESFMISIPQGAHPGGTAAIGEFVDSNLETQIDNLFICDASVLPVSPGLPPILTLVALGKRLAKSLR